MSGRRLDVTATQAVSSLLATLTGALAASGLGIAGTIIGAAVMSLASTVGAAVYKHYLARSNERLRMAAANLAPRASNHGVTAAAARRHLAHEPNQAAPVRHDTQPGRAKTGAAKTGTAESSTAKTGTEESGTAKTGTVKAGAATTPDLTETEVMPTLVGLSHTWQLAHEDAAAHAGGLHAATRPGTLHAAAHAGGLAAVGEPDWTQDLLPAAETESSDTPGSGDGPRDPRRSHNGRHGARHRWLALAGVALGVFLAGMGTITAFEAIAGKPLEAVVWHRPGSGTTVGGLLGHSPRRQRGSQPAHSTSPATSPSSPASSQPGTTPTPKPTTSVSPTPTPSAPASPSSPTSPAPGSSASSGTGTGTGTSPGLKTAPSSNSIP